MSNEPNYLLAGLNCKGLIHLVIGSGPLAAIRCSQSLQCGARPILVAPHDATLPTRLKTYIDHGLVGWEHKEFHEQDLFRLGRPDVDCVVDAVFITQDPEKDEVKKIVAICKRKRIPVNVVDSPQLCTFSLLSTHCDGPLQIGVTTNGRGCKLASRIRRTVASSLPPNLGDACIRLGKVRQSLIHSDPGLGDLEESLDQKSDFNRLVTQKDTRGHAARWLSQVCEYWPLERLATVTDDDISQVLAAPAEVSTKHDTSEGYKVNNLKQPRGSIVLAGSGPGDPNLLTHATYQAIKAADLILADKLVPSAILDLIPPSTPVKIARKFPGNATAAQKEFVDAAVTAANTGKTVVRLKQGDPFIYGRGAEEVEAFRKAGLGDRVTVIPGITSALSAPLLASIPLTHRGVADQVLICTGTSKNGCAPVPPEFVESRTVVFLMALHRVRDLVCELTTASPGETEQRRTLWPLDTSCAVIERASCPDQRVIRTTLSHLVEAVEIEGSRPPGLLVVGASCQVLKGYEESMPWVTEEGTTPSLKSQVLG